MDILEIKTVTTRKPHNCWGCAIEFPAGTQMEVCVDADGGVISRSYWCPKCQAVIDQMPSYDTQDGFSYGEIGMMERETNGNE